MRKFALLVALVMIGCPSSDDGGAGEGGEWVCEPDPTGTWELDYVLESGNCGPLTTEILNLDSDETADGVVDQACEGPEPTGDACEGRTAMDTCDLVLPDGTAARISRTFFLRQVSPDEMTGKYMVRIATQGDACAGAYDIIATRL